MSRPNAAPRTHGRKAGKRARQAARAVGKAAAQANRQRLYQLCLARCEGNLAETAKLFQTTSAAFPEMPPEVQEKLLQTMADSLRTIAALKEEAKAAACEAQLGAPQAAAPAT